MAERYWVGGSGNWSDNTNHWSASSGGSPGASKPSGGDNTHWDSNSDTGGSPFLVTCDENPGSDTFDFNTNLGQIDFVSYNLGCSILNLLDGRGSSNPHLMGSGTHSVFAGCKCTTDVNWETSTLGMEGGSSASVELSSASNDLYSIYFDTFGSAVYTFEYGDTSAWNVAGELRVKTGGTFNCVDASETDLLALAIAGDLVVETGATFTAAPTMAINVGGDIDIHVSGTFNESTSTVVCDGTATQSLIASEAAHAFYKLQISNTSADVDLGTDIRVLNLLTIDTDAKLDLVTAYDVYLRGSGTMLVLNGILYGDSASVIWEINAGGTTTIAGGTGWNINGSYTGAAILVQIIDTVTTTVRLGGDIDNVLAFSIESTAAGSGATASFYSDDYDLTTYVFVRVGPDLVADACTFTSYWGSSTIEWGNFSFVRWQWDAATHNLQSSTWQVGVYWSVYGPSTSAVDTQQTFVPGTSFVDVRYIGESWMAFGAHDGIAKFYDLRLNNPGGTAYVYIKPIVTNDLTLADNGSSSETSVECQWLVDINNLILDADYADVTFAFYETGQNYLRKKPTWDGLSTFRNRIRSRVATNQADVQCDEAGGVVTRTDIQDNNLSGNAVDATDGTNIDSGNNSVFWIFVLATVDGDRSSPAGVLRGVLVGTP
jgi:hypothetical protein